MAFKLRGTGSNPNKIYLHPTADGAPVGSRHYEYVSADTPATVSGSGYIDNSTEDGETALGMLLPGDLVWVYQVGSIDDTRTLSEDKAAGITDISLHVVLENTGSVIDMSDDLLGATVTYGA